VPRSRSSGLCLPLLPAGQTWRRPPAAIAADLAASLRPALPFVSRIETVGGYINFFIDHATLISQTIEDTRRSGSRLGASSAGAGKPILIEFYYPNIAKPFHIGHAFTTILGHALARFYDHLGYHTVRLNHLGDYGTQFGKLIVAFNLWGDEQALAEHPIQELLRIYVKFHEEAREHPNSRSGARTVSPAGGAPSRNRSRSGSGSAI
jgi:arginyl-tRNA synthetase